MFCDKCGMELRDGDLFCQNCGNKINGGSAQESQDAAGAAAWGTGADAAAAGPEAVSQEMLQEMPQGKNQQRQFCPNCGTENGISDMYCKECGMPLGGAGFSGGMQINPPPADSPKPGKKKWAMIAVGVAAAVAVLAIAAAAVGRLVMGPGGKVLQAAAATMKEKPELVNDFGALSDILLADEYTVGADVEYDGNTVTGEFVNTVSDKQIKVNVDLDGGQIHFLCGVHSGVLKATLADWDYVLVYDPARENDGVIYDGFPKREIELFNDALQNITRQKVRVSEIQEDAAAAFLQEFKALDLRKVNSREFEIDHKERECEGYEARIREKNIVNFMSDFGERVSKRLDKSVIDDFEDGMDDLIDEIEDSGFDVDVTFYLYKKKLAAVIVESDRNQKCGIEFRGGDYRMQNMAIVYEDDGDMQELLTIDTRRRDSREIIELEADDMDITITYDTKSGEIAFEYSEFDEDYLIEGVYKHSGSEVSFALEDCEGIPGLENGDIGLNIYVKKAADIEKYRGEEFDLGSADEDELEDLLDDLDDYLRDYEEIFNRVYRSL